MRTQYVYGLKNADSPDKIFYVGVTSRPKGRLSTHIKEHGAGVSMVILDEFEAQDKGGIEEVESMWMVLIEREHGALVLNKRRTSAWGSYDSIKVKIERLKAQLKDPMYSSHHVTNDQGEKMSELLDKRYGT